MPGILKMNLLKPSVQNVWQNLDSGTYTVVGTLVGKAVPTSGILYLWTGSGKMVQASTYQYIPVQHGTGQYEISTLVQCSMYQYIPVHAFNKICGFPTHR
jgi:hypothetical protein